MEWLKKPRSDVDIHTVSIGLLAKPVGGELQHNKDATEINYFKKLPENTIKEHREFLKKNKLIN